MSVQTQINRISGNITAALAAIAEKGVTVPDGSNSDALAELISSIEAGGGISNNIVAGSFTLAESLTKASPLYINVTFPKNEFPLMYCVYEDVSNLDFTDTSHTATRIRYLIASKLLDRRYNRYYVISSYNAASSYNMKYAGNTTVNINTGFSNSGGIIGTMDISLNSNQIRFNATVDGEPYLVGRIYNYLLYWGD